MAYISGYVSAAVIVMVIINTRFRPFFKYNIHQRLYALFLNKLAMGLREKKQMKEQKTELFKHIFEYRKDIRRDIKVLDVGAGTEENAIYLAPNTKLIALDPNPHLHKFARANVAAAGMTAEFVIGVAEDLPFNDEEFDVVICTLVLCSVSDIIKAMTEIRRVLKPDGLFLFLEHVREERSTWTWLIQLMTEPVLRLIGGGCSCRKLTGFYVNSTGFKNVRLSSFESQDLPPPCRPCIVGRARK